MAENYRIFCRAAGFDSDSLAAGAQDHHCNIRRVTREQQGVGIWKPRDRESIDGLCTDDPEVTLVIYCADCVPLYFVDPEHHAIGLAHAGWRGTVMGMARAMVERMKEEFGTDPALLRRQSAPPFAGIALRWMSLWQRSFEAAGQRAFCHRAGRRKIPCRPLGVQPPFPSGSGGSSGTDHSGKSVYHV